MKKVLLAILALVIVTTALGTAAAFLTNETLLTNLLEIEQTEEDKVKVATSYADHIEKGQLLVQNGYYTLAITEFSQASQDNPNLADPYILIGNTHLLTQNYEKALSNFEKALEKNENSTEALTGMAQTQIHLEMFDEARAALDGASSTDTTLKYYQAILYAHDAEYERSQSQFQEVLAEIPEAQYFLDAYAEYDLEKEGQETHLQTLLAQACTEIGQYELAVSMLFTVLSENANYRDAWILLGYSYLNLEKYEDATSAFEQAIELDITKPETNYFLALAYFGQDRLEESLTYLELALVYGFEPQVQVYQKLAEVYFLQEDYESSTRNYEKVLQLNDGDINYFIRPVWLNMDYLDDIEHALELSEWAISAHPDDAMSYNLKGWVLIAMEDYSEAEDYFEEALDIDPELAAAYLNLGTIAEIQEDYEEAKNLYRQAYTLDQNDSVGGLAAEKYNNLLNTS